VLVACVIFMETVRFRNWNRYPELLPHGSLFFRHPISYVQQYVAVYRMNLAEDSVETRMQRDKQWADDERRRAFREKHDIPETTGLTQWLGMGTVEEEERLKRKEEKRLEREREEEERVLKAQQAKEEGTQEKKKRRVILGIWELPGL